MLYHYHRPEQVCGSVVPYFNTSFLRRVPACKNMLYNIVDKVDRHIHPDSSAAQHQPMAAGGDIVVNVCGRRLS